MRGLSAQELLTIWEVGLQAHPVDRAIIILETVLPDTPRDSLLALSIGRRDARLLTIREATFGSQHAGFAECPACKERLEFAFNVADIRVLPETWDAINPTSTEQVHEVTVKGFHMRYRLPNSADLACITYHRDVLAARNLLLRHCVSQVHRDGVEVEVGTLPEDVIADVGNRMLAIDPQAEVQIELSCPVCAHGWSVIFDIVSFFWSEICAQARRLMREVHTLACAYGWSEADILTLSAARRQFYLEMVT